jgi:predicted nucleic acid-binding protein
MPVGNEAIAVNTGPLVALAACGSLELLSTLHTHVLVPRAVADEYGRGGAGSLAAPLPGAFEVCELSSGIPLVLTTHLDVGEASAIALALERRLGLVVIDERRGRLIAREAGLRVTGSLGVLLRAKRESLIPDVRSRIRQMIEHGIWMADALVSAVLREAGE